jgi:hypothetical protein
LLNAFCWALFLIAAATTTLAVRGIWFHDQWWWYGKTRGWALRSNWGRVSLCVLDNPSGEKSWHWGRTEAWPEMPWELDAPGPMAKRFEWFTFAHASGRYANYRLWVLPSWFPPIVAALLPAWWWPKQIRRWRGQRRSAKRLCPCCGYDLRATPERCPECGTIPAKA